MPHPTRVFASQAHADVSHSHTSNMLRPSRRQKHVTRLALAAHQLRSLCALLAESIHEPLLPSPFLPTTHGGELLHRR